MSDWTLRPGDAADAPALIRIVERASASYAEFAPGWRWPPEHLQLHEQRLREQLPSPATYCLLAEVDGMPVGHVAFLPARTEYGAGEEIPGLAHLWQLFVIPDWWGSGVAHDLLTRAVEEARRRGYERIQLATPRDAGRARRFYEREGWSVTGAEQEESMLGLPLVHYAISI